MPKFETRRRVPFTARQMYDLVADVEKYPEFLPLCEALRVRSRTEAPPGTLLIADMEVGFGAIRERFTSRVELDPDASRISASYVDGPFRHMDNRWHFEDVAGSATQSSNVTFFIDYEFKSLVLQVLMGSMFDVAFRRFTDAFEQRARRVYATV